MKKKSENEISNQLGEANVPEFYANAVGVGVSVMEFEFQHLLIDSSQKVKGALNVRMSPQAAKFLSAGLAQKVAEYEKEHGTLTLPPQL